MNYLYFDFLQPIVSLCVCVCNLMSQKNFLLVVLFLNYGTEPESQLGKNLIFAFLVSLT